MASNMRMCTKYAIHRLYAVHFTYYCPSSRLRPRNLRISSAILWFWSTRKLSCRMKHTQVVVPRHSCMTACIHDGMPLEKPFFWLIHMDENWRLYFNILLHCYYLLLQTSLLPVITVPLLPVITNLIITCYYGPIITSLLPVITSSLLPVITVPLLHHYYIVMTCYYIFIITCYYILIITSLLHHYYLLLLISLLPVITVPLLRHYYVIITSLLLHVIMVWLLLIITLACFIITSLLPIMSSILIITYY